MDGKVKDVNYRTVLETLIVVEEVVTSLQVEVCVYKKFHKENNLLILGQIFF